MPWLRTRFRVGTYYTCVAVFIVGLWIIFGVEWNYVEKLKEDHDYSNKRQQVLPRSSFELNQNVTVSINFGNFTHGSRKMKELDSKLDSKKDIPEDIYQILKNRKRHELILNKVIQDFWWYVHTFLEELSVGEKKVDYDQVLKNFAYRYSSLQWRYAELAEYQSNGGELEPNWKYWQARVSQELNTVMEKRIHRLQNPVDCKSAKKLVCYVAKACGFGCQIHHVSYCFIIAYATQRTLILDSNSWKYSPNGWNVIFKPISSSCTEIPHDIQHFSMTATALAVSLQAIDNISPKPMQLPMAIPRDIADRLMSFHGAPFVWFVAQFLKILLKPSDELKSFISEKKTALGLTKRDGPIVGLHVRRTDKRSEAQYHGIEEYMKHVSDWYDLYELAHGGRETSSKRSVFIATDEPSVIKDAKIKFPSYAIFSDSEVSSLASRTNTRYSVNSLFGLMFDVTVLSECDYMVCTFSSQVCRLSYELMQNHHVDASQKYYSLDDIYYFGGQHAHDVVAIEEHHQSSHHPDIEFEVGDHLGIAGNEKNGYSVGIHRKTRKRGPFPSYKVVDHVRIADFPKYLD